MTIQTNALPLTMRGSLMSRVSQQKPAGNDSGSARISSTGLSGSIASFPSITSSASETVETCTRQRRIHQNTASDSPSQTYEKGNSPNKTTRRANTQMIHICHTWLLWSHLPFIRIIIIDPYSPYLTSLKSSTFHNNNNNHIERRNSRFLQSPHWATNCLQHVRSCGSDVIVCKSCATHQALITCNLQCVTWYNGTAQLLSLTELKSHLF